MAILGRFPCARAWIRSSIFSSTADCIFSTRDCNILSYSTASCAFNSIKMPVVGVSKVKQGGRKIHWVFIGCPGVGKGTYASRLSSLLGVPHIATGDLVRRELSSSGPLASKEILEGVVKIELVINLKLREEALIAKCLGRRICSECGGNFNVACIDLKDDNGNPDLYLAPILPPPQCASKLITRTDDEEEEVVRKRLQIYHETTQPVEEFYRSRGKLSEFDLPGGIPESWSKLLQLLNLYEEHEHSRLQLEN